MNFLAQALMTQANRKVVVNPKGKMYFYRIREFLRMNPQKFCGYEVVEDTNGFIDEVYKTLTNYGINF